MDLLPGHSAHVEYRRRLLKCAESSGSSYTEILDSGIDETEGSSLLGDDESSWEIKQACLQWCIELNIEYVEACASNVDFDKCKLYSICALLPIIHFPQVSCSYA